MRCPYCDALDTRVRDTREVPPDGIRRRRECKQCGQRFTTYECIASINLLIIKRDGRREEFNRDKLIKSMLTACSKRAVPVKLIEEAVRRIETDLYARNKGEIQSLEVGRLVMDHLREIDEVAYVRFASVYRRFEDIDSMAEEIRNLIAQKKLDEERKNQLPLPLIMKI